MKIEFLPQQRSGNLEITTKKERIMNHGITTGSTRRGGNASLLCQAYYAALFSQGIIRHSSLTARI
jgi:hypothetical protein